MAIFLAVVAAVLLGTSDFFAARAARHAPSLTVTRTVVLTSVVLSPILLVIVPSQWVGRDIVLGALSGLAMITGLMLLYHGYKVAPMGVVAPTSSVLLAAVPVIVDVVRGQRPSALATVGIVIGLVAIVLTSYQPGGSGSTRLGAVLGLTSGVAFGIAFTLMGEVSARAGLAPVVAQRLAGITLLVVIALVRPEPFIVQHPLGRRMAMVGGVVAMFAIASLQLAFRDGASGPVSVAASQFATVAVILAVLFNRERMRWWQASGVAATAIAVALIAAG
ncbi:MAG: DMT family transporter [Actinomycetota bacterium]